MCFLCHAVTVLPGVLSQVAGMLFKACAHHNVYQFSMLSGNSVDPELEDRGRGEAHECQRCASQGLCSMGGQARAPTDSSVQEEHATVRSRLR